jgi:hypothetical protein
MACSPCVNGVFMEWKQHRLYKPGMENLKGNGCFRGQSSTEIHLVIRRARDLRKLPIHEIYGL